jgi:hypothetical protein
MEVAGGRGQKLGFFQDELRLSYRRVLAAWCEDPEFRAFFMQQIRESRFTALRWETPAVSTASVQEDFECVLLDSPFLDVPANPQDFRDYLRPGAAVVDFPNLGGDAHLIVPCRQSADANYSHLAGFHRTAPLRQQHALWQAVGECVSSKLSKTPLWLNTAGGGVDWLHVRLDSRPKYYAYLPYRAGAA